MALVDDPRDMILRMFHLQSLEGFEDACKVFPDGLTAPKSPFGDDDLVFGVFKERHLFSQRGLASKGKLAVSWSEIVQSAVIYSGGKDVLQIEGRDGARLRIDLSSPARKRPAYRIQQLVDGLAQRWSEAAYIGLPAMDIEAFFAKASRPSDFESTFFLKSHVPHSRRRS